ncbi:hypothetical protein MKW98_002959 [Papaver atlanticum]|uniref:Cytochrome P450 n=1 Tax=Papaver atlanticum TaxID=357466 RepID=A0AAD4XYM6_9MAGN|nr:hypothetical protein MKW98_002959 [Papaver atlanticum]
MTEMNTEILCIRLGSINVISVTSPELACEFFKTQDVVFASRPITMGTEYMTRGFLTCGRIAPGEQWKKMRRVLTSELTSPAALNWLLRRRNEESNNLVIAEMINQPDVLQKAVKEIDMVVGKDRLVQESDIPKLNYVKACAKEAFPLTSFGVPHMSNSDAIVGGYFIPKHSHVIVSRYGLGRNPRVMNEPLKFKPERHFKTHEDGSGTTVDLAEPELKYMSFGIGRRGCPLMSIMLLARLLQAFDWIPPDGQSMIDLCLRNVGCTRRDRPA